MEIKVYDFPTLEDGRTAIESEYCRLLTLRREAVLDNEEKDWMDTANSWLMDSNYDT